MATVWGVPAEQGHIACYWMAFVHLDRARISSYVVHNHSFYLIEEALRLSQCQALWL